MALSNKNFDDLTEQDLVDQLVSGIPEGVLVDYKRNIYGGADANVKEFLKDISSFANTAGGHLVIGMDEAGGVPTALTPLPGDSDKDLQRLESLARDGLEPRISGLRMKAIQINSDYAIVIGFRKAITRPTASLRAIQIASTGETLPARTSTALMNFAWSLTPRPARSTECELSGRNAWQKSKPVKLSFRS